MKIALLTHFTPTPEGDYNELFKLTGPLRDEYCARHGYEHIVQNGFYKYPEFYYAFDRLVLLRDLLDKPDAADVFFVLNVQAVICNITKRIEDIIDDEHDVYFSKDVHGGNCGAYIVKNTDFTRRWLDFIISQEPNYRSAPWKEQKCWCDWWLHENWTWKIHLLPQRAINSYFYHLYKPWPPGETPGDFRRGDLLVNLPGLNLAQRLDLVKQILANDMIIR